MLDFTEVLTLMNIAWQTGPTVGKSREQVVAEMRSQVGTQPAGSFMHGIKDSTVEAAIDSLEGSTPALIRFEQGRYFLTQEGTDYLRYLRPLLVTMSMLSSMVTPP